MAVAAVPGGLSTREPSLGAAVHTGVIQSFTKPINLPSVTFTPCHREPKVKALSLKLTVDTDLDCPLTSCEQFKLLFCPLQSEATPAPR